MTDILAEFFSHVSPEEARMAVYFLRGRVAHVYEATELGMVEVTGSQITVSPVHAVAREKPRDGGLALGFPRFVHWNKDKAPKQATTVQEIYDLYRRLRTRSGRPPQSVAGSRARRCDQARGGWNPSRSSDAGATPDQRGNRLRFAAQLEQRLAIVLPWIGL